MARAAVSTPKRSPRVKTRQAKAAVVTPPEKAKKSNRSSKKNQVERTQSFPPVWSGSQPRQGAVIQPHTLLLGTHPAVKSLERSEYYGHTMNAFWWIAGDCLGFRRATGVSESTGKPYQFTKSLKHENIIPYEEQLETLIQSGYCLWDIVRCCSRRGSLDQDIVDETPNDIYGFCREHPSIRRIVICNGNSGSQMFARHFRPWLQSGQLVPGVDGQSKLFGKRPTEPNRDYWVSDHTITLISAIAVSPAAARYSYEEKRDFWDEHVYTPGLALLKGDKSAYAMSMHLYWRSWTLKDEQPQQH